MTVARVFRPDRDWKQIKGKVEDYPIGAVDGVIMGGASPQPVGRFPGVVSTEGQIGIPFEQDSGVLVQQGDFLAIDGVLYSVRGPRAWTEEHAFAGVEDVVDDYYWVQVEASHGTGR